MNRQGKESIGSLFESKGGVHLTIYLRNHGDLADLKQQLASALEKAHDSLESAFSDSSGEMEKFLSPLESLLEDGRLMSRFNGSIGLFRTRSEFRVLNLPVEVELSCFVANTFHIKPLLRWTQTDREVLLVGMEEDFVHLYRCGLDYCQKVDYVAFPQRMVELIKKDSNRSSVESFLLGEYSRSVFGLVGDWIESIAGDSRACLYIAGEERFIKKFINSQRYSSYIRVPFVPRFSAEKMRDVVTAVRMLVRGTAERELTRLITSIKVNRDTVRVRKSIREIAQAAAEGRVKRLFIADDREVFGRVDSKTGKLTIHPFDLDHEDDDLLDDIAQLVIAKGGEVYVAKKRDLPGERLILAFLKDDERHYETPAASPYQPSSEKRGIA